MDVIGEVSVDILMHTPHDDRRKCIARRMTFHCCVELRSASVRVPSDQMRDKQQFSLRKKQCIELVCEPRKDFKLARQHLKVAFQPWVGHRKKLLKPRYRRSAK